MFMPGQLPLDLRLHDDATFENFLKADNEALCLALQAALADRKPSGETFYIHGQPDSGRSHLLQAACHAMSSHVPDCAAMYLPLRDESLEPSVLEGMENCALVALDDVDIVFGQSLWEEALFHFYNRCAEQEVVLLFAAQAPPRLAAVLQLEDLRSRLSHSVIFQIKPLNDEQKIEAIQLRARNIGLELSNEVGQFLLRHYPRDLSALFALLERLDKASIALQRKPTLPLVRDLLAYPFPIV